jgi:hypothetical protein
MILILDTCDIALAGEPSGGITLRLDNIEGLPNTSILLPIQKDNAEKLVTAASQTLKLTTVEVADNQAMKRAVQDAGQ